MSDRNNITRIKAVYNALGKLADTVVFVGGAVVSLYATRNSSETRATEDVDIVVEVLSLKDYSAIEEKLRQQGFTHVTDSNVICRYRIDGVVVDVMPTRSDIIGFSNIWYKDGYENAIEYVIDEQHTVRIFPAPYFIACKLEAFKNRGKNDGRTSSDFEDIVYILNNRADVFEEIISATDSVRYYIQEAFTELKANHHLTEWISAHLDYADLSRTGFIISRIDTLIINQ